MAYFYVLSLVCEKGSYLRLFASSIIRQKLNKKCAPPAIIPIICFHNTKGGGNRETQGCGDHKAKKITEMNSFGGNLTNVELCPSIDVCCILVFL